MNGGRLVNSLLLPHALDLLALQLSRRLSGKKPLGLCARALELLRQAACWAHQLLNDLMRQPMPGRGFGDHNVLQLLRAHHVPGIRRIFVHGAFHGFELQRIHGLSDGLARNGRLKPQGPILQLHKGQLLFQRGRL